jgi:hypothetical protein
MNYYRAFESQDTSGTCQKRPLRRQMAFQRKAKAALVTRPG